MIRFRNPCVRLVGLFAVGLLVISGFADVPGSAQRKIAPRKLAGAKKKQAPAAKRLATFRGFADWVTSVAYSPNGKSLATGSYELVKCWDPKTYKTQTTLKVKSGFVKALAFSPDTKWLVGGHYQALTVWDVARHKPVRTLKGHRAYVTGISFSHDGKLMATSSEDETVRIWNTADWTPRKTSREMKHTYPVLDVAFQPKTYFLASVAGDETRVTKPGELIWWEATSGMEVKTMRDHTKAATGVAFSPDGRNIVTTSVDEKVLVYEWGKSEPLGFFGGHSRPTTCALFTPDGSTIVSASGGRAKGKNEVKLWAHETGEEWGSFEPHRSRITAIALSPDGKRLLTASYDKTAALWDIGPILSKAGKTIEVAVAQNGPPPPPLPENRVAAAANKDALPNASDAKSEKKKTLRAGIIGLDTSHVIAFTRVLNADDAKPDVAGCRVVAAYPKGSPDIESSVSRVPKYTKQIKAMGVEIVDSIPELLKRVDVVLLETNDGRPHLEQVLPVMKAGKPVFIDKPIAGTLADAVAIFEAAKKYKVPVFSSSSLRYGKSTQAVRNGSIGEVKSCEAHSPCSLEKTHPDLFWYGIHGVEALFTAMGTGCQSVTRKVHTADKDVVVGTWKGGRVGIFTGYRKGGKGYGGTAYGTKGNATVGKSEGYRPLLVEIVKFFKTGVPPVTAEETLEIYAFMEAADESKRKDKTLVTLESVMKKARAGAKKRLTDLD